jgi:hypothetical protein
MRTFILLIFGLSLLGSCKKDLSNPTEITLGQEEGMIETIDYKVLEGTIFNADTSAIDLNNDGILDVEIISGGNPNGLTGSIAEARIRSLHPSAKLHVNQIQDTTFYYETYQFTSNPSNGEDMVILSKSFSCRRESDNYEVNSVAPKFLLDPNVYGEKISFGSSFQEVDLTFVELNTSSFEPTGLVDQGVVYYGLTSHFKDCWGFPMNTWRYIGVKLFTPSGPKLGWIRLQLLSSSKVSIHSWAIQN